MLSKKMMSWLTKSNLIKSLNQIMKSNNCKLANINEILCSPQAKNLQIERYNPCFWAHFGENFAPIL